jgi:hypothetical protein
MFATRLRMHWQDGLDAGRRMNLSNLPFDPGPKDYEADRAPAIQ